MKIEEMKVTCDCGFQMVIPANSTHVCGKCKKLIGVSVVVESYRVTIEKGEST